MSVHPSVSEPPGGSPQATIEPADLADRLAGLEPMTILDVRAEAKDSIEAAGASFRHLPAAHVLADP
ncbi:MAG: hypothetical protein JSS97_17070, partial [Actinobacteria bacterium]|nr:hypothetical protein [Actinomycetota bacterium]